MSGFALSAEQSAAAHSSADFLMIVAPPGCGKSEVLAHRAAHQISLLKKNQRVFALTYTKRARTNLEERLRAVLGHARMRRHVAVYNFHGFATQVIQAHGRTIGLDLDNLLPPKSTTLRRAMEAVDAGPDQSDAEELLREIKRQPFSDREVLGAIQDTPPSRARDLAVLVETERQAVNQLHYEDLLRHAQRLLQIPAIARLYQAHFGAVLVDEFQDLSMQQLDLARLSCSSRQTFAGDPLQGIFSWAGAEPSRVEAAVRERTGDPIRLRESYRSSPSVLETVNSISETIEPGSSLISARPEHWTGGGLSAKLSLSDRAEEAGILVELARAVLNREPTASVGIICRAAWRRRDIDRAFDDAADLHVRRWENSIDDPQTVALIQSIIATLPRATTIEEARTAVLDSLDISDVDGRELVDGAFDVLALTGSSTAKAAIRSIRASDPKQAVGPGVHLLNAHGGKGQQFDWVAVTGLEDAHLPGKRNNQGEKLAEEHRVLLVMLSRARHGLLVTRVQYTDGWYGPKPEVPSRWWESLHAKCDTIDEVMAHLEGASPL